MFLLTIILILTTLVVKPGQLDSLKGLLKTEKEVRKSYDLKLELGKKYLNLDADSSEYFYRSAIKQAEELGDSALANIYWRLGSAQQRRGKYTKAIDSYNSALDLAKKLKDTLFQADVLTNLGYLFMDSDDIINAGKKFYEAKNIFEKFSDKPYKIAFYTNFARYLEELNKLDSAKKMRFKAIELSKKDGKYSIASINYVNIATIHVTQEQLDSAEKYFELALDAAQKSGSKKALAMINLNQGMLNGRNGDYRKSIIHLKKAIPFFKRTEPEGLFHAYNNIALAYDSLKKFDSALYYTRLKSDVNDSIEKYKLNAKISEIEAIKENELKDLKIQELEKIRETQSKFNYALVFIAFLILIILLLVIRAYFKKRKNLEYFKKLNKEFDKKNIELKKSEKVLKELNQTKDKFFSIIAHDLRNPVNSIDRGLEFLIKNKSMLDPEDIDELIDETASNAKNLNGLLENLLNWSRTQRGLITVEEEKFELDKLLVMIYDLFKFIAKAKDVKLFLEESNYIIESDKNLINNIIRNLVNNAVKFTPEGGKVIISSKRSDGKMIISVKDTGVGMDEDKIQSLFDMGQNVSTHGTKGEKGTGLGLVLCYEFAQELGGWIDVKSKLGSGSEFSLVIPNK